MLVGNAAARGCGGQRIHGARYTVIGSASGLDGDPVAHGVGASGGLRDGRRRAVLLVSALRPAGICSPSGMRFVRGSPCNDGWGIRVRLALLHLAMSMTMAFAANPAGAQVPCAISSGETHGVVRVVDAETIALDDGTEV